MPCLHCENCSVGLLNMSGILAHSCIDRPAVTHASCICFAEQPLKKRHATNGLQVQGNAKIVRMLSSKHCQTIMPCAFPLLQHVASLSLNGQQLRRAMGHGFGQGAGHHQAEALWNPATAAGLAFLCHPDSGMLSHSYHSIGFKTACLSVLSHAAFQCQPDLGMLSQGHHSICSNASLLRCV